MMPNIFWSRQSTAKYKAEFARLMVEAERLNEDMRRERVEIERLKAEIEQIRDETRSLFNSADTNQQARAWQHQLDITALDKENQFLRMEYARLCAECNPPRNPDERLF